MLWIWQRRKMFVGLHWQALFLSDIFPTLFLDLKTCLSSKHQFWSFMFGLLPWKLTNTPLKIDGWFRCFISWKNIVPYLGASGKLIACLGLHSYGGYLSGFLAGRKTVWMWGPGMRYFFPQKEALLECWIIWEVLSNVFYFHTYFGKMSILTNIFQSGWNHQLDNVFFIHDLY